MGLGVLKQLEKTHKAGLVFNDLKLDNILAGYRQEIEEYCGEDSNCFENCSLNLIDFGFATRWVDKKTGKHIEETTLSKFKGNIMFSSAHQLSFKSTSRRDDLISLCYLMVYLLNDCQLPGIDLSDEALERSQLSQVQRVLAAKLAHTTENLFCKQASVLQAFGREVFSLGFSEEPNYNRLKQLLSDIITSKDAASDISTDDITDAGEEETIEVNLIQTHNYKSIKNSQKAQIKMNKLKI